ncbi:Phenylacetaldehyde reductase [Linum perenne]
MIGKAVCVTGGSGYIASWLIKLLLRHGYTVIASVRDPCDLKKTAHLLELDGAEERLHLYRADLLEEGSFDSAVRGCVGVFHTASPVSFDVADPQVEVVDPAVNGTLNVLKSCAKSPSVKRVIVTSSIASMFYTGKPSTEDTVADETWFSDPAVCRDLQVWYQLSKTLAESAAWEFAKENNIDLVTINPGFVNGPFLQPTPTFSAEMVLNLVNGDLKKTGHLLELDGAKERLRLYRADLLEEGSFDSAVRGCDGVFHTASPVSFSAVDPQKEILDPAIKGTLNVLKSCAKSPSIKRVIVTSSTASMLNTGKPVTEDTVADETWFSDPAVCEQHKNWYPLSKTLAERVAWEFAKENNIDLITMHPGIVNGPFLQPSLTFSIEIVLNLVNAGSKTYPKFYYWSVDVRDVAEAHIKAFETESAHGRYSLVGTNADIPQVLQIIHRLYPMLPIPTK